MRIYSILVRALIWGLSALSAVVGFSAISVAIFGTLRSRSKRPYVLMIVFYAAYTLQIFKQLIEEVVLTGGPAPSAALIRASFILDTVLGMAVIAAAALYLHELFSVAVRRLRDVLVAVAAAAVVLLYALPSSASFRQAEGIIYLGFPIYAGGTIYHLLFAYLLVVGFSGPKRDRPVRELVLIWATLVFASVGLVESVGNMIRYLRDPVIRIAYSDGSFPISLVPHIFMGAVMIYYFGGYILADSPRAEAIPEAFLAKYGISQREREVIALMDRGLSNPEIAERLFVSLATVKTHAHNIYEKTGAKSRYALSHMIRSANR